MNPATRKLLKKRRRYARLVGPAIPEALITAIVEGVRDRIIYDMNKSSRMARALRAARSRPLTDTGDLR